MTNILVTSIGCAPASIIARTLQKENKYNVLGIDIQDECVGNFITNLYIKCPKLSESNYWNFIEDLIFKNKINFVFVTNSIEVLEWSQKKTLLVEKYNCKVFLNDEQIIKICDDKMNTYKWCIENNIKIPPIVGLDYRPCIIKPLIGCGAANIEILKTNINIISENANRNINNFIVQKYINGIEFTSDIISDENGNVINIVPKQRLLVKNGQSFKSTIKMDEDIINFVKNVALKINNKSVINIQVIKEFETNEIFLIEINPRWTTTIGLSIEGGVNMPLMLVEKDLTPKIVNNNLMMIRDYKEYFINSNV